MIGFRAGISIAIALVLCVALAVIGWGARSAAERTIVPEILAKAESVGRSAASLIEVAHGAGIPLERMVGVRAYFADLRKANREFVLIRLSAPDGRELARAGDAAGMADAPVVHTAVTTRAGVPIADIAVTVDPGVISQEVGGVLIDVAFIGIVSLLIALELVALVIGTSGIAALAALEERLRALAKGRLALHETGTESRARDLVAPIDQQMSRLAERHAAARAAAERAGDAEALAQLEQISRRTGLGAVTTPECQAAVAVRPALFLFMLAEELTRPFLPRFAQALAPAGGGIGPDMAASLPIVAFMAVVALCQIPFAALSERMGRRPGFLIGALLAASGYALSASTGDYMMFLAARVTTAVGYALVFVSAQGHVVDHSVGNARTTALAVFVRAIMVASLCGPPIGGVVADRLGPQAAFLLAAGLAIVALGVAALTLPAVRQAAKGAGLAWSDLRDAARAPRLMALLVGCAFPAKLLLAALCFLLVPLQLQALGYSSAAIGRFQMIYPLLMVMLVPVFAAMADHTSARASFVVLGGVVAGAGALALPFYPGVPTIALALVMLGIGQSMSIASQSALVADSASATGGRSAGVLGLFRLVERSGNAAGPAAAGALLASLGFALAGALLGAVVVAGAAMYALAGRGTLRGTATHGASASEGNAL
ncbi:MFS transporter [Xanthobacter pseudotagetidis]|uniref:MFS transporter n=1 Tax=Xanthobacter pseudotagetidis TaxID=3119911 RepID=UPI0037269BF2